ncbi:MAG TPA: N-acetylglucosamine-6-phosphate deacetylase [Vibrio sp.]|uniref:N-acetylglucosamine-6-phosphate deacetylase n=1 Tax=Vibrio sp. TaxID=678 RepID=UPI000EDE0E44|nr:N-acetylglucosamine-6-phosphate deacetylase [Vibrio sp.]HCH01233.1 N-acetylglucosamine-6-phosphate deacetylase [Vibrio sp.]
MMKQQHYLASKVLIGDKWFENQVLTINAQGKIESFTSKLESQVHDIVDLGEVMLLPGLIDAHVHGAMGVDVMDATHNALNTMSEFFAQNGVTGFLATTVTAPPKKIEAALCQIGESYVSGVTGAQLLGGYLEGPYFTEKNKGAHPTEWFRELSTEEFDRWIGIANGSLKKVALAPEKSHVDTVIPHLKQQNVRVMLGHTDASFDQVQSAFDAGADGIVHCYNGMRGLHHRDPGVVGAGLCHHSSYVEMIADGHHVHPTAVDVAHRCCGERLMLITDAMQATGMPDGEYQLGEYQVNVVDGVVRTYEGGLAGSTLVLLDAVKNISEWLSIPFEQAWLRASLTPARSLSLDHELGTLEVGKSASMVALSLDGKINATWVQGKMVYKA